MASAYTVGIASETRAFKQGVDSGIIDPLEDAQKELTELGRNRGPDQLEQGMRDAQRATERLEDEAKDAANTIWGVTLLVDSRYQEGSTGVDVYESQEVHPGVQS